MEIRWLTELGPGDADRFGGKAANLGELIRLGVRVPPGFAIGVSAYQAHAHRSGLNERLAPLVAEGDWPAVEKAAVAGMSALPVDEALSTGILRLFRALGASTLAVRSSATVEDGAEASFAGQFRTLLEVEGEEGLLEAIPCCWASLWTRRALEYRYRRGTDHFSCGMGIVVQAMVPAEVSGVLFTVDPVAQRSDQILVQAAPGLGEALVSGQETGTVYRVDRDSLRILDSKGETEELTSGQVSELCRVGLMVEKHFGCPQDMEFGLLRGEVSFFQTRPITAFSPALVDPLEPVRNPTWPERVILPMAAEHYATAPKPLDNLVFTRLVGAAVHGLKLFGWSVSPEDEASFRREIWRQAYRFPRHRPTWRAFFQGWQQLRLLRKDWLAWWMEGPEPALRELSEPVEVAAMTDESLLHHADLILDEWEGFLKERMYAAGALRADSLLKLLVTLAVGFGDRSRVLADLQGGLETPTERANLALWRLSRKAREAPAIRSAVRDRSLEALDDTPEGRAFRGCVEEFLRAYGHREGGSWYLSSPTWGRDPMQVWGLLSSLVEAEEPPADPSLAWERYVIARELVLGRLADVPLLRRLFLWILEGVRGLTIFREQSHFDLTRPLLVLQDVAAEWGVRLHSRRALSDPTGVFFLTSDEVREWLLGTPPAPEEAQEIVARRRATYQIVNTRWVAERAPKGRSGAGLRGLAASPGSAMGRVRILRGEDQFHLLKEGEILVCSYTNPSWTPLFSLAKAVVTETGGPASHAAIVARERGIPCVMGVSGAMTLLRDGGEILVDGDQGFVHRVWREETPWSCLMMELHRPEERGSGPNEPGS